MMKYCFLSLLLLSSIVSSAQEKFIAKEIWGAEANVLWTGAEHIWIKQENTIPAFIQFRNGSEPLEETFFFIMRKTFHLPATYSFNLLSDESDPLGWQHKRFQLTVNNVPVKDGIFMLHLVDGKVKKFNGYLFKNITANTAASLSETAALEFALRSIGAETYKWQVAGEEGMLKQETGDPNASYFPKGQLEIVQAGGSRSNNFRLAWKFDVYAQQPLSRNYVYVDAQSGEVLKKANRIHNANTAGTATTVYRGNRAITADSYNGQYRLREVPRGNGIHTYNMQTGTSYAGSVEFLDANNIWNNVNAAKDQYATDAHWGGEMTYDFYTTMGRNSIDNAGFALNLYMHYDVNYVNAFWDGTRMTFGDGNANYDPLVSLDITGHEISHGLTERTSNLDYQDESGALNESFSDIFGTAVEWYADSTLGNWLIGEDIGGAFRSMSNPNSYGDPDTYAGTNWYTGTGDNGGVHTNSSVQNHWYYRLSQGGAGTNDIGNAYNVTGIGRHKATQIAWRNDVFYLSSTSDYADARFYAIQSANDLFGVCSPEAVSTTKAWYAVGVGGDFVYGADAQFTASPLSGCTVPFTVNFTNTSTNSTSYAWTFGDGGTSTAANPSHIYNVLGTYTVKLVSNGGACGIDSLIRSNYVSVSTSNPCVVIMPTSGTYQTQTACSGTIYDSGGPTGNYTDNTNSTVTIAPTGASQVQLHFTQFNMEDTYDFLYVYDGPTIASPVIGSYTGTNIPADITSSGSSITIRQFTDPGVVASGFAIQWACINPNSPPVANFKADVTQTCSGTIKFTDLSTGGPSSWLWNFGDGTTSTLQHPIHGYVNNGTYSVSLKATNAFGNNTVTKTNYITVAKPAGPSVSNASYCGPHAFTLSLSDVNPVTWFDTAGNVLANGTSYVTPVLNTTTTYYVQDTQPQPIYHVGPLTNGIGSGMYYNGTQTRAERFKVFKNSKLVSVFVYAQGAGYRTIQYRDSLGGVITNKTVYIPNGASRINVNIDLIPGGPYELGLRDTMNLYRNSSGAVYPYNDANGIVSIIGNNAAGSAAYYYFFYDWEVKENDCISQRVPVVATVNPVPTATSSSTNISCNGGSNGTAVITPAGGTPVFTYHWNNNAATASISNVTAGTYTVTATDAVGCSVTASQTITQPAALVPATTVTNVLCNGGNTGAVNLSVTGGVTNYAYNWGGGVTTQNRSALTAGTYIVTVTDANLCTVTGSATVTQPAALVPSTTVTNVLCNGGNTGAVNLSVAGGVTNYAYNWGGGVISQNRSSLVAGTYTVTITDANLCTTTASATVTQPSALVPSTSVTNAACNGGNTGAINLSVTGGTGSYAYNWGGGITTQNRTGLAAGTYTVTVTDANLCTASTSATISQTSGLVLSTTVTNVLCNGASTGAINLTVNGGAPNYAYNWGGGITTQNRTALAAGTYTVTVTDANLCTGSATAPVTQPAALVPSTTVTNVLCNGGNTGAINLSVTGGVSNYAYNWGGGVTTQNRTALSVGIYTVTVIDANLCTSTASATVTQPAALVPIAAVTNVLCNGGSTGSISLNVTGGVITYGYNWGGGITTQNRTALSAGVYTVTITDANLCTTTASAAVTQPAALVPTTTVTNVLCNGGNTGAINLTVSGGVLNYAYNWGSVTTQNRSALTAGTYTVTVVDANLCTVSTSATVTQASALSPTFTIANVLCHGGNTGSINLNVSGGTANYTYGWAGGITTQNRVALSAGTYPVTITDANACTATASATVTEPAALSATAVATAALCHGGNTGAVDLTVTGGTPNYSYHWNGGITTQDLSSVSAGTYMVTITDAGSCTTVTSAVVTEPATLSAVTTVSNVLCNGGNTGAINLAVTGGTVNYSYNWGGGITSQNRSALAAGSYSVTVTDAHLCTAITSATVTQPAAIAASTVVTNVLCNAGNTGAVNLSVTGGNVNYTYNWTGGANTQDLSGLSAGAYSVVITDANSCTATASATVNEPAALSLTTSSTDAICGQSNGSISASANGGVPGYTISWSNGVQAATVMGLAAGTYTVTVHDNNSCSSTASATIVNSGSLAANASAVNATCFGNADGSALVSITGGTQPYTYSWSNGQNTATITNLSAGTYAVTITDSQGCLTTATEIVSQNSAINVSVTLVEASCGSTNGSVSATSSGGNPGYSYLWNTGQSTVSVSNLGAGTYTVTVTDAASCTATGLAVVNATGNLSANTSAVDVACFGAASGSATVNVLSGTQPYIYAWSNGSGGATISNVGAGTYTVTITDNAGCVTTVTETISQPTAINVITAVVNASGTGSDGAVTLSVSGGSGAYTYHWSNGQTSSALSNLSAGTYLVTVTDANGCTTATSAVVIAAGCAVTFNTSTTDVHCFNTNTGMAGVIVTAGTAPYTYLWSNGDTTASITNIGAGAYGVTVTDLNHCTGSSFVMINEPTGMSMFISATGVHCYGEKNGSATVSVIGGTAPYSFLWCNGDTDHTAQSLVGSSRVDLQACKLEYSIVSPK